MFFNYCHIKLIIYGMAMNTDPGNQKKARLHNPAYPVISLGDAVEAARKVRAQRKAEAHIGSALHTLGYARHGGSLRIIAALDHYGLTEQSGSKEDRKIRLSELAQDIIHLEESDQRRQDALKTAALYPTIHASLWERYGAHLPDDSELSFPNKG